MDWRLRRVSLLFFVLLFTFIVLMFVNEYKNMEDLRAEYPDLPEEAFELRKDSLAVWSIRLILQFLIPIFFLTSRLSQGISRWAGWRRGIVTSGILYGLVFVTIVFLIRLPLDYYSSFVLSHKYGLTSRAL